LHGLMHQTVIPGGRYTPYLENLTRLDHYQTRLDHYQNSLHTVPFGYNASRLREEGIQVYSVKKEWYEIGIMTVQTNFGRDIRCYNPERTICDLLSPRYQADLALVSEAVKRYFRKKDKNVPLLLNYAKTFGVEKRIKSYMEVLM